MTSRNPQEEKHRAILVQNNGTLSNQTIETSYKPAGAQVLVRVKYSAINPADIRHAYMGLYKTSSVAGYEWMGTAVDTGNDSTFSIGQDLFGLTMPGFDGSPRPLSSGAHQDFLLTDPSMTWPVPEGLDHKQAAALPVGLQTAADALFNILGYGFEPSALEGVSPRGIAILIWGGASTCGLSAIQVAKAAGFEPIFTTASAKNHAALRDLGATQCFDYRDPEVVEKIQEAVKKSGKQLTTVFDAVSAGLGVFDPEPVQPYDLTKSTPSLARKCLSDVAEEELRLASVLPVEHDPRWKFCLGMRLEGSETIGVPQDPIWPRRLEKFVQWWLENPSAFRNPNIKVVAGVEEGMRQIQRSFAGAVSLEKVLIEHPFT